MNRLSRIIKAMKDVRGSRVVSIVKHKYSKPQVLRCRWGT